MANRHKAQCRASGGRTVYQGAGSAVAKEAKANFNRGGKAGGKIPGGKGKGRFAKGGCVSSPMSSAGGGSATKNPFCQ